jgi:membrane-bound inhibitor of C-type lysozyme
MTRTLALGLAAALSLASLAAPPSAEAKTIKARYRCADGSSVAATFDTPAAGLGQVTLATGGKVMVLPQAMSADGGRYADDSVEFWVKGRGATFTRDGQPLSCQTR